jgi:thiosulfate/3-mercaptopyruvate sulfurtransferase
MKLMAMYSVQLRNYAARVAGCCMHKWGSIEQSPARVAARAITKVKYGSGSMVQRLPLGMAAGMALMVKPALLRCASATEIASAATSSPGQVVQAADLASGLPGGVEPQTVVSPEWLKSMLSNDKLKVVDASWYMPNEKRDTFQEYKDKHIPGAVFFDVDAISDLTSHLPHMLPSEAAFEAAVSALGIQNDSLVVVYDTKGIFSVARVWWMFRVFGHEKVWVLNGGLPKWQDAGFPVVSHESQLESSTEAVAAVKKVYSGQQIPEVKFKATLQPHLVWSADQVRNNLQEKKYQLVDARGKARFDGTAPEPRKGIRGGHVPGSNCIPFTEVLSKSGTLLAPEELSKKFSDAGVVAEDPIVTSCGTGVTACILALALHRLGKDDVPVYDGSWTEWGSLSATDAPVETNVGATSA